MSDSADDSERPFVRAAAALRGAPADHSAEIFALQQRIRAESQTHALGVVELSTRRPLARHPWWLGIAAAVVAFAIGIGVGRGSDRTARAGNSAANGQNDRAIAFAFVAPGAHNVSLVGDFNGWDAHATPLERADGRTTWSVAVRLPPGRHVYAFVIDGVTWMADPQGPLAPEQWFGQRNSVIVIPEDRRS
ncbi:MAG: isoamylase early set domain-containing protein [bacterium]